MFLQLFSVVDVVGFLDLFFLLCFSIPFLEMLRLIQRIRRPLNRHYPITTTQPIIPPPLRKLHMRMRMLMINQIISIDLLNPPQLHPRKPPDIQRSFLYRGNIHLRLELRLLLLRFRWGLLLLFLLSPDL